MTTVLWILGGIGVWFVVALGLGLLLGGGIRIADRHQQHQPHNRWS